MADGVGVEIKGFKEFRRALRESEDATGRELTQAIKKAGEPIRAEAERNASRASRSGRLAGGYRIRASGTKGRIVNKVPYAEGAEWGRHGKWSGFMKYGGPGRFAYKALQEKTDEAVDILSAELEEIITIQGWAR